MSQTEPSSTSSSPRYDSTNTTDTSPFPTPLARSTPSTIEINNNNLVYDKSFSLNFLKFDQVNKSSGELKNYNSSKRSNTTNISKRANSGKKTTTDTRMAVQKILQNFGLSKYCYHFRFIDLNKFLTLKELDLIAIGITRRQDIRKIMDIIKEITRTP
uniref:SAM domain-containing protein n=1 Tax=Glossina brevipalpis TaxID=37001 RepID=A0A1A9X4C0_9MUSC